MFHLRGVAIAKHMRILCIRTPFGSHKTSLQTIVYRGYQLNYVQIVSKQCVFWLNVKVKAKFVVKNWNSRLFIVKMI